MMTFEDFVCEVYGMFGDNWLGDSFLDPERHIKAQARCRESCGDRYDSGLTFSNSWSMGGTAGSCYDKLGDPPLIVGSEMEPEDPKEFDVILENLTPNLTFMQYKGIVRDVMVRKEVYHHDYYGGHTTEGHKGFNIKDLYDALVKRNLLG